MLSSGKGVAESPAIWEDALKGAVGVNPLMPEPL